MDGTPNEGYGAYSFLEHWTIEDLTDAATVAEQLVDSPAWSLLMRVLDERERKIVNQLIVTPQLEAMRMEGLRSMVNGIRQLRVIPESVVTARDRRRANIEDQQRQQGDHRGDR